MTTFLGNRLVGATLMCFFLGEFRTLGVYKVLVGANLVFALLRVSLCGCLGANLVFALLHAPLCGWLEV